MARVSGGDDVPGGGGSGGGGGGGSGGGGGGGPVRTPVDLYAFGKKEGPRNVRPEADFGVQSYDDIVGPAPLGEKQGGASSWGNPYDADAKVSGHFHKLPAGTELPPGMGVIADEPGNTHHTFFPTVPMTCEEFDCAFRKLPWEYAGNKKKK